MTFSPASNPQRSAGTLVPDAFFTRLLPRLENINEVKVILRLFFRLQHQAGYYRWVAARDLVADAELQTVFKDAAAAEAAIQQVLDLATEPGLIRRLSWEREGVTEVVYCLDTAAAGKLAAEIAAGNFPGGPEAKAARPDIYSLYEANIGMITPILADELREAESLYPPDWIDKAFKEAVLLNKRNWKYIARILERWGTEGINGEPGRDTQKRPDPDKFIRGKYGRLVQR